MLMQKSSKGREKGHFEASWKLLARDKNLCFALPGHGFKINLERQSSLSADDNQIKWVINSLLLIVLKVT